MGERKYPIVECIECDGSGIEGINTDDGSSTVCDWCGGPGRVVLVPVPEDERMVVVVTEGGKWPEWAVTGSGTGADLGYDWMREVLDALAEGGE
jgi:hypothetical protein